MSTSDETQDQEHKRRKISGWQLPFYLAGAIAFTLVGLHLHSESFPGAESAQLRKTPLLLMSFVSTPGTKIRLTMIVNPSRSCARAGMVRKCQAGSDATLYATVSKSGSAGNAKPPHGTILIVSTKPGTSCVGYPCSPFGPESTRTALVLGAQRRAVEHLYLLTVSISKLGTGGNPIPVADFQLPPVIQNVNGSFFAHMPDIVGSLTTKNTSTQTVSSCLNGIGFGSSPPPKTSGSSSGCGTAGSTSSSFEATGLSPSFSAILNVYPVIMTETRDLHGRSASDTVFLPPLRTRSKLATVLDKRHPSREQVVDLFGSSSSYQIIPGSRHDNLWWVGKTVKLTEVMAGAQSSLADSRVDTVLPPNGNLQGNSYVWKGTGSLAPTISATKINAAVSQSNDAFLAGVFFAIAAAAAIALLQSVPDAIPLPQWWPKLPRPRRNRIHFKFRAPPRLRASLARVKRQFSSRRTTPS